MPAAGHIDFPLVVHSGFPTGTLYLAQAETELAGDLQRTNSQPILVR